MVPKFVHPYDSREIGLFEVSDPSLSVTSSWTAQSLYSKCAIIPQDANFEDPLPKAILEAENRIIAYRDYYDATVAIWNVQSLLSPKDEIEFPDVRVRTARVN